MSLSKREQKKEKGNKMPTPASNKVIISPHNNQNISRKVPFSVVEAYKTIRTNLIFLLGHSNNQVLTFSSSNAGEGKSTTSINVSVAFAQMGGKILLIDCDLRRSSVHKKLQLDNSKGLSNVVAGFFDYKQAIIHYNSNLDILTAGPTPPNPSELLSSSAFGDLIDEVKKEYDYVIIDTPPINVVSDALLIAPRTSGIVLVVRTGFTPYDALQHTLEAAKFANINVLGTILNGTDPSSNRYYKYRYYKRYRYSRYGRYKSYKPYKAYGAYNYSYEKNADSKE